MVERLLYVVVALLILVAFLFGGWISSNIRLTKALEANGEVVKLFVELLNKYLPLEKQL